MNDKPDERIAELPCWKGGVRVAPLPGGITNRNFLVEDARGKYVARLGAERRILGIDRQSELLCQEAAAAAGVAPRVVYHGAGVLVSEFIAARTLRAEDVRDPTVLRRLAALLHRLHDSWDRLEGEILYFSPFQTVRTYAASARRIGARLPAEIDSLLDEAGALERELPPFRPVLCHNDVLAANILDDGDRLWLVDWEYAGVGRPLFDLAGACGNCALGEEFEQCLLAAYTASTAAAAAATRELKVLKTVSLLREALWAVIQTVASDLEFEYSEYARENFAAFAAARAELLTAR